MVPQEKQITPIQAMIKVAFDKLLALQLDKSLDTKYEIILEKIFNFLSPFYSNITESNTLQDYILDKIQELELIKSELKSEGIWVNLLSPQSQSNLVKTIINFIISTKSSYTLANQEIINQELTRYLKS